MPDRGYLVLHERCRPSQRFSNNLPKADMGPHLFPCDMQDRLDQLVIKDPGEILEPQEYLGKTAKQGFLGSQVWKGVEVHHTVAGRECYLSFA